MLKKAIVLSVDRDQFSDETIKQIEQIAKVANIREMDEIFWSDFFFGMGIYGMITGCFGEQ